MIWAIAPSSEQLMILLDFGLLFKSSMCESKPNQIRRDPAFVSTEAGLSQPKISRFFETGSLCYWSGPLRTYMNLIRNVKKRPG